jgi:hypothetical protein
MSISSEERATKLSHSKAHLVQQYRSAAELLNTSSISVLQSFILYLTSIRRCDDKWLLLFWTGIAIQVAISVGLHRGGSDFGLDAFATETRRRLWWHLMLISRKLEG